jgi:Chaperone of endosialidase
MRFFVFLATVLFPLSALTAPPVTTATTLEWQSTDAVVLTLQRPDGEVVTETFAAGRNPMLRADNLGDGQYSYELRASDGSRVQSGSFTVRSGAVVPPNLRETAVRPPFKTAPATFFSDFVSAAGGLCGGADCTSTESMGTATIKGKANNVRLKFEDTSTSVGFPTTDWQISANDTFSGGANKLFVEDLTAGTVPFLIEGGTPTPAKSLTIADSLSPTIQMEQSASPFQTWDIVANNNNFYVRDVNHETNPFIILPSAPYNSLVIDASGRIGLGVAAPSYQIHHSSGARLDAGVWVNSSSRAVKQDIRDLDRDAAFDALRQLQPVTFAYKTKPADTHVGFIAEDVPELVATRDRTGLSSMDIVAVLTKVVQEQEKTIADLRARLERLETK